MMHLSGFLKMSMEGSFACVDGSHVDFDNRFVPFGLMAGGKAAQVGHLLQKVW